MDCSELKRWLQETDAARLAELWRRADAARRASVGDAVHLRGLVEISNNCVRHCHYCGLRAPNRRLTRYRMAADEIMTCVRQAVRFGYGTVVLQSGEDPGLTTGWVAELVRRIKSQTDLAVTLSLGEREADELGAWREAGADRYLLRFETSNRLLYEQIHPPRAGCASDRMVLLRVLRELGYEVGSGVMIGIPGQTFADLAADIALFRTLDLDMIGVGPYLPHPDTPLARDQGIKGSKGRGEQPEGPGLAGADVGSSLSRFANPSADQVPSDELTTYKAIALARLVCPGANIPSTTALATINRANGRELGLARGANIIMPNLTPLGYRRCYEIYPAKACLYETAEQCRHCLERRIAALGRTIGRGRGDSPNLRARAAVCAAKGAGSRDG